MPAKDRHHDLVVRALARAGWHVVAEQLAVILPTRRLWIDIQATQEPSRQIVLVEVKGFENMPSPVDYLAAAVGQYVLYLAALEYTQSDAVLYMAVPTAAFTGILNEELGQQAIRRAGIKLMVFDPATEEIVQWIP